MEMLSGSQIDSFISATSLVWSSSIVLIMVGLVYFIKYKEGHSSTKNSQFFLLYLLTIILNVLEYVLNIVMQKNPSYETIIYKTYILTGFFWNISMIFYIIKYIKTIDGDTNFTTFRIAKALLMVLATVCCFILDIGATLESNGKFYVLTGSLNTTYNISALVSFFILLLIALIFRKKLPKSFCTLCILTFGLYLIIYAFKYFTGYIVKESVFIYTLLVLVIFNTTSNQDKEVVNKLSSVKDYLTNINNKRSKLINRISNDLGESLNDLALYNDDLYLSKDHNRLVIKNNSREVMNPINELSEYMVNVRDIYILESGIQVVNGQYKISALIDNIYDKLSPLIKYKKINYNVVVGENTFLNYVGDFNKVEKSIFNILYTMISNSKEGDDIYLSISSNQSDQKSIELIFTIRVLSSSLVDITSLNLNNYIETNQAFNKSDLRVVVSNKLLELLNSKIDISSGENNNVYTITVSQGYQDSALYSGIK